MKKINTSKYLKNNNFVASKKMGQNFLINEDIKKNIVKKANLDENTLVIEIGPGLGAISKIILKTNYLIAIELDKRLFAYLSDTFKNNNKFHIINNDVLKCDLDEIINNNPFKINFNKVVVIANLPYSISSLILAKLSKTKLISYAIIMVQKEMAQRICAKVGSDDYNAFSVWLQNFSKINFLFDVGPNNFIPKPKVMSSVIKLNFFHSNFNDDFYDSFKRFLNICFLHRRKTIFNNLKTVFDINKIITVLSELNINKVERPQNITIPQYVHMLNKLKE